MVSLLVDSSFAAPTTTSYFQNLELVTSLVEPSDGGNFEAVISNSASNGSVPTTTSQSAASESKHVSFKLVLLAAMTLVPIFAL